MSQNKAKLIEAEEHVKNGNKFLAKTMFRWQPDYLLAAPEFEKAATCFYNANDLDQSILYYIKAADMQNRNGSAYRAAQLMEQAGKISLDQKKGNQSIQLTVKCYEDASSYYKDMGELNKAADILRKGGKLLEILDVDSALKTYLEACDLLELAGKPHFAVETFRTTFTFLVRNKKFKESLTLLDRLINIFSSLEQKSNLHKCYLSHTIIELSMKDVVSADRTFTKHLQSDDYLHADECALAEDLIISFKNGNEEMLQTTLKKHGFQYLDNEIGKLSRELSIYGIKNESSTISSSNPIKKKPTKNFNDRNIQIEENKDEARQELFNKSSSSSSTTTTTTLKKKTNGIDTINEKPICEQIKQVKLNDKKENDHSFSMDDFEDYGKANENEIDLT